MSAAAKRRRLVMLWLVVLGRRPVSVSAMFIAVRGRTVMLLLGLVLWLMMMLLVVIVLLVLLLLLLVVVLLVVLLRLLVVELLLRLLLRLLRGGRVGSLVLHHGFQVAVVLRVPAAVKLLLVLLVLLGLLVLLRGRAVLAAAASAATGCANTSGLAVVLLPRRARLALVPLGERHGLHVRAEHLLVVAVVDELDHARVAIGRHLVHQGPVELAVFPILGQHLLSREKPFGAR